MLRRAIRERTGLFIASFGIMKNDVQLFVDEKSNYILSLTHTTHVEQCCVTGSACK